MNNVYCEAGKPERLSNFLNPITMVKNLYRHRDLIRQFAWRDFVSRYKGSSLGVLWSFITPLTMPVVYAFVFSVVENVCILGVIMYVFWLNYPCFIAVNSTQFFAD